MIPPLLTLLTSNQEQEQNHTKILGWPKSLFRFFHETVMENPNELFGQPNIFDVSFILVLLKEE